MKQSFRIHLKSEGNIKRFLFIETIVSDLYEFETVVVVPSTYEADTNGFGALFGKGYCHPGFSKSQSWNDHILKSFEIKAYNNVCRSELTVAENEAENLQDFFKKACRPGEWVSDKHVDAQLSKFGITK